MKYTTQLDLSLKFSVYDSGWGPVLHISGEKSEGLIFHFFQHDEKIAILTNDPRR